MAYDNFEFDFLHKISSEEESMKEKNKSLIPLFNEIKDTIKQVKSNEMTELSKNY